MNEQHRKIYRHYYTFGQSRYTEFAICAKSYFPRSPIITINIHQSIFLSHLNIKIKLHNIILILI